MTKIWCNHSPPKSDINDDKVNQEKTETSMKLAWGGKGWELLFWGQAGIQAFFNLKRKRFYYLVIHKLPSGRKIWHCYNLQRYKTSRQHYTAIPHYHANTATETIRCINLQTDQCFKIKTKYTSGTTKISLNTCNIIIKLIFWVIIDLEYLCFQSLECLSPLWGKNDLFSFYKTIFTEK